MRNEQGFTLLGVLMVLIIFSVLGISIIAIASSSVKLSDNEREDQAVYYIAETGIAVAYEEIDRLLEIILNEVKSEYINSQMVEKDEFVFWHKFHAKVKEEMKKLQVSSPVFERNIGEIPYANIKIETLDSEQLKYVIHSEGRIGDKKRVATQEITIDLEDDLNIPDKNSPSMKLPENTAVFVRQTIKLHSAYVEGNMGTVYTKSPSILIEGYIYNNNNYYYKDVFYVPKGLKENAIQRPHWVNKMEINEIEFGEFPELPAFPIFPNYTKRKEFSNIPENGQSTIVLQNHKYIKSLKVKGSHKLTIDIGQSDKEIVLDELEISGRGQIDVVGDGQLTLYIKDEMIFANSARLNDNKPHNPLKIFFKGNSINLQGDTVIHGSIYAEKASILVGGSDSIFGSLLTGGNSFTVTGGGNIQPSLYFAPKAHFSILSGGRVNGVVIGNSVSITGNGRVKFQRPLEDEWSLGLWDNNNESIDYEEALKSIQILIKKEAITEK